MTTSSSTEKITGSSIYQEAQHHVNKMTRDLAFDEVDRGEPRLSSFKGQPSSQTTSANAPEHPIKFIMSSRLRTIFVVVMAIINAIYAIYRLHRIGLGYLSWKVVTDKHIAEIAPLS